MRAVILAAGRGSRLGDRTADRPKCLTRLAGRTLLDWQLCALRAAGADEITVVRGYLAEALTGDFATRDNPRWAETNMVATLAAAAPLLRAGPVIVSYADIVYSPVAVRRLAASDGELAITYDRQWAALWRERFADPLADAETFRSRDGWLETIGGRATRMEEIEGQYMGLLRFTPAAWTAAERLLAALEPGRADRLDMTSLLRLLLADGERVRTLPVDGGWCEVDDADDLAAYERRLAGVEAGEPWSHDWRPGAPGASW